MIIDEVMSGFCRTGKWFGYEHHDIEPDIISMAKGITWVTFHQEGLWFLIRFRIVLMIGFYP